MLIYLAIFVLPLVFFGMKLPRESEAEVADVSRDWGRFHPFGVAEKDLVLRLPVPDFASVGLAVLRNKG